MKSRSLFGTTALVALLITLTPALAFDESKYPDLKGVWVRARVPGVVGQPSYDPTKTQGLAQKAPLKPEFQAVLEANLKDQAEGGQTGDPTYTCLAPGMPRVMNPYGEMEIVITPDTTHILLEHIHDSRRIFTDGRGWPPDEIEPTFQGFSLGRWIDHRQRPLRHARSGDPPFQGPARLRRDRPAAAPRQPDHRARAHPLEQERS
jgi:hypothetical protein